MCDPSGMRWIAFALGTAVVAGVGLAPARAEAKVRGSQGIEIEGAQDRRGFFIGAGLGFGGSFFFADHFIPAARADLVIGGGVTKRFTLGLDLHVTPYIARGVGVGFGADFEATGFIWRGLYVRGAAGLGGVPRRERSSDDVDGISVGVGGSVGVGYEFFLNATAAMGVGVVYDARFVPRTRFPRQSLLVAGRISWY
jgi:hypothetical protein